MIQVCKKTSGIPYRIEALNINVYSLEEINYFVYNHMNLVYREFFCENLYEYIEKELDFAPLALRMRSLEEENASTREFIMCLLKESCYYSASDLSKVANLVANMDTMTRSDRLLMEAGVCVREKKYGSALQILRDILSGAKENDPALSGAYLARVAFSAGSIYARLFLCRSANEYFVRAYEYYPDEMYARACVYASLICGDNEELLRTIIRFKISDETLEKIKAHIEQVKDAVRGEEGFSLLPCAPEEEEEEKQIAKWKSEYYNMQC